MVMLVCSLLVRVLEWLKRKQVLKYYISICEALYQTATELLQELQNTSFHLQLGVLYWALVLLVPFLIFSAIALLFLSVVFTYLSSLLIHGIYTTPAPKLKMPSVVGMMLVIEPRGDGTYERTGTAEWEEDAFVACTPEIR